MSDYRIRYHDMVGHSFPGVTFPGEKKIYRIGPEFYNMKEFFDANIDQHDIFVFESLNADDNSWQCWYGVCKCIADAFCLQLRS